MRYCLRDLLWFVAVIAAALGGFCYRSPEVNQLAKAWRNERADNMKLGLYVEMRNAADRHPYFHKPLPLIWQTSDDAPCPLEAPSPGTADDPLHDLFEFRYEAREIINRRSQP